MALEGAQNFRTEIAATPLDCFKIITDFETYPRWSSSIQQTRVLEYDSAGIGRVVEYQLDLGFKNLRYVLEYSYRKPRTLTWQAVTGDVEAIEGAYQFRKLASRLTEANCRQAVRLGFWVPGPLRKLAEQTALKQSVIEFKTEVERRLAARREKGSAGVRD